MRDICSFTLSPGSRGLPLSRVLGLKVNDAGFLPSMGRGHASDYTCDPMITERLVGVWGRGAVPPREPEKAPKRSGDGGKMDICSDPHTLPLWGGGIIFTRPI